MDETLLLVRDADPRTASAVAGEVSGAGGQVLQRYGSRVLLVRAAEQVIRVVLGRFLNAVESFAGPVPDGRVPTGDMQARLAVSAWNSRHAPEFQARRDSRPGAGVSWGSPNFEPEGRPHAGDE